MNVTAMGGTLANWALGSHPQLTLTLTSPSPHPHLTLGLKLGSPSAHPMNVTACGGRRRGVVPKKTSPAQRPSRPWWQEPFNRSCVAVNSISSAHLHVQCTPVGRTCRWRTCRWCPCRWADESKENGPLVFHNPPLSHVPHWGEDQLAAGQANQPLPSIVPFLPAMVTLVALVADTKGLGIGRIRRPV